MADYSLREVFKQFGKKIFGSCVNSCVSESQNLPLAASQGKVLQEQITQLNSNFDLKNLFKATIAREETLLSYAQRLTTVGLYIVYSQFATDSPLSNQVSFTIINYAGQNYIYLYLFVYDGIYYATVDSTISSIKWKKII